jgi:hypothetical protein
MSKETSEEKVSDKSTKSDKAIKTKETKKEEVIPPGMPHSEYNMSLEPKE